MSRDLTGGQGASIVLEAVGHMAPEQGPTQ